MFQLFALALASQAAPAPLPFVAKPCASPQAAAHATCGTVSVQEDRARPGARRIDLNVIVIHAKNPRPVRLALFDINGGPGLADTENASFYLTEGAPYWADRDIVLIDQRGTGGSNPLDCPELEAAEHALQPMFPVAAVRACRNRLSARADLTKYTTEDWIGDIDDVRRALGYARIDLTALSYGTAAALAYIARYPEHVRSAVLQSVAPAFSMPPKDHAAVGQAALERLFADCSADARCARAYPHLRADLVRGLQRLREGGKVEPQVAMERFRSTMYSPAGLRGMPATFHRLARGDPSVLQPVANGQGFKYYLGVYLTITCAESLPWFNYERAAARARRTLFGDYRLRRLKGACDAWPRARVSARRLAPVRSRVPVLFISGGRDAVTPPRWAAEVKRGFPNGRQIVIPWSGHVYDGLSNLDTCLDPMILSFLDSADARRVDVRCIPKMRPPPFEVDAAGR